MPDEESLQELIKRVTAEQSYTEFTGLPFGMPWTSAGGMAPGSELRGKVWGGQSKNIDIGGAGDYWPATRDVADPFQWTIPGFGRRPHIEDIADQLDRMHRIDRRGRWDLYDPWTPLGTPGKMRLEKWQGKFQKMRAKGFYGMIDPVSFDEEFAAKKLFIGKRGGKFYETAEMGDTTDILGDLEADIIETKEEKRSRVERGEVPEGSLESVASEDAAAKWLRESGEDPNQFEAGSAITGDILPEPGISVVGESELFAGSMRSKPKLRKFVVSNKDIALRAANWEYFSKNRLAGEGFGRIFKFGKWTTDFGFMGKPSVTGSAVYSHEAALIDAFKEMTGQTKTFRGPWGESVDFNDLTLVGKMSSNIAGQKEMRLVELVNKAATTKQASDIKLAYRSFKELQAGKLAVRHWSMYMEDTTLLMKRLRAVSKIGNKTLRAQEQLSLTNEINDVFLGPLKNYFSTHKEYYSGSEYFKPLNISGYEGLMEELKGAGSGQIYQTSAGEQIVAEDIQNLRDIQIKRKEGAIAPISELHSEYISSIMGSAAKEGSRRRFQLSAVRMPGIYGGKEFPHATQLFFGGGEFAGFMQDKIAQQFQKEYASGYVGEVWAEFYKGKNLTARIFADEAGRQSLGMVQGTGIFQGKELVDELGEMMSQRWQKAFGGAEEIIKSDEITRKIMSAMYPKKLHTMKTSFAPLLEKEAGAARGSWVAMTVAAGALLLWGASRLGRDRAMSAKDVPSSQYGSAGSPELGTASYSPKTRVTPQNTGYSTNIDMEAQDVRGVSDYRGIANNLGMMSRTALGAGSGRTSLHVIDDSSRMDSHSTRRQMNQQLNI